MNELSSSERQILQKNTLFRGLSQEGLGNALRFFGGTVKSHRRGEVLHRAGSPLTSFGLVLSGSVQVYMEDISGNPMIMATVTEGETFGESLCFLKTEEQPVSVEATSNSRILWMTTGRLEQSRTGFSPEEAALLHRFIQTLAQRTLAMNDRIQVLSKGSLRAKLLTFFSQYAHKCGGDRFSVPMDRSDMAVYLGADRSALSRELSKMQEEGLISFHKNVFVLKKDIFDPENR